MLQSNIGCHIGDAPMSHFTYADDLALVAPTAWALNKLLEVFSKLCIKAFHHI